MSQDDTLCNRCAAREERDPDVDILEIGENLEDLETKYAICNGCGITAVGKRDGEILVSRNGEWEPYNYQPKEE